MNYSKIYTQLIERAKIRDLTCYTERHHIIPKCLGGNNGIKNIVKLTAKEHFIVHRLLVLMHPKNEKLKYALWAISTLLHNQYRKERHIPSARIYESIKQEMSIATKKRLSKNNPWLGKKHSKLSKLRQSESAKKRIIPEATEKIRREKIGKAHLGRKLSKEWCENISKTKVGDKNPMFGKTGAKHHNSKKVIQLSLEGNFIKEWDNARIAADVLNISYGGISSCCRGNGKTSGKFKWKFK